MPANTARGFPYPLGTDRLADGDDAIHNLASAIDSRVGTHATGVATLPIVAANAGVTVAIVFPAGRFIQAPRLMVTALTSQAQSVTVAVVPATVTVNGATITGVRLSGGTSPFDVMWHAVDAP